MKKVDYSTATEPAVRMNHWLALPSNYEHETAWPLLIFLHGAGERGDNLDQVKTHGPPKRIAAGDEFPFVVVSPQCEADAWWSGDAVAALTRDVIDTYRIDRRRVYLTGLSMGGFGTWETVSMHPDLFAAIAPICGGGQPHLVGRHQHVPTWAFHGAHDEVVPVERTQEMVDALQALSAPVRFTLYPEARHDSWTETYDNPELYAWFLQHSRPE